MSLRFVISSTLVIKSQKTQFVQIRGVCHLKYTYLIISFVFRPYSRTYNTYTKMGFSIFFRVKTK